MIWGGLSGILVATSDFSSTLVHAKAESMLIVIRISPQETDRTGTGLSFLLCDGATKNIFERMKKKKQNCWK